MERANPSDALHAHYAKFGDGLMTMLLNIQGPSVNHQLVDKALHRIFLKYPYLNYRLQIIRHESLSQTLSQTLSQENETSQKQHDQDLPEDITCSSKFHQWVKYDQDNYLLEVVEAEKQANGDGAEETPLQVFERKTSQTTIPIDSPYIRVFFIKVTASTMNHIGFVFNHALMDGSSRLIFVHEFVNFLKQAYLNEDEPIPQQDAQNHNIRPISINDVFQLLPDECKKPVAFPSFAINAVPFDVQGSDNTRQRFFTASLSDEKEKENILQQLTAKCRENGVTLHSALTAAFVIQILELLKQKPTKAEEEVKTFIFGTPINLRPQLLQYLENSTHGEVCKQVKTLSNFVGMTLYTFQSDKKVSSFWELAKDIKKSNNEQVERKEPLSLVATLASFIEHMPLRHLGLSLQKPTEERGGVRSSITISNLGYLADISRDYGPFRVESLPAFYTNGKPGSPQPFWVGVHTVRNTLHLSISYREPSYSPQTIQAIARGVLKQLREIVLT